MHELPPAGRLAAWGSAALHGAVSPDEAADAVAARDGPGHRVAGLPGEDEPVTLAYAVARLRTLHATALRLVLPRPGDVSGLPGPAATNAEAVAAGAAVLTTGRCQLAILPAGRALWQVRPVDADPRTPLSVRDAARELTAVVRDVAADLARLDVARWEPAAAEVVGRDRVGAGTALPPSADPEAHALLAQGLRLAAVVRVALGSDGAAISGPEMAGRERALRDLGDAARRAVEAACSG